MSKFLTLLLLGLGCAHVALGQLPQVSSGRIVRHENLASRHVPPRHVDVWLPEGYSPRRKYPVVYMHDGQMLFDSATTWNRQEWGVDEVLAGLFAEGRARRCIVVAIWNTPDRRVEYYPQKAFVTLPAAWQDSLRKDIGGTAREPRSDSYLRFLVEELKPFIDSQYATRPGRKHTFIMGSSMGGLISMYAMCEYPAVFGAAACLSTHWPGSVFRNEPRIAQGFVDYLREHAPDPRTHRFYFDYGTATLDAWYEPYQLQVDEVLRGKGFSAKNLRTLRCAGEPHTEAAWRKRLYEPLLFLLGR